MFVCILIISCCNFHTRHPQTPADQINIFDYTTLRVDDQMVFTRTM